MSLPPATICLRTWYSASQLQTACPLLHYFTACLSTIVTLVAFLQRVEQLDAFAKSDVCGSQQGSADGCPKQAQEEVGTETWP